MKGDRRIYIENLIRDETAKADEKLSFLNDLTPTCIKIGLASTEYIKVSEAVIRNIIQICDDRLKNGEANKRKYKEERKKNLIVKNLPNHLLPLKMVATKEDVYSDELTLDEKMAQQRRMFIVMNGH